MIIIKKNTEKDSKAGGSNVCVCVRVRVCIHGYEASLSMFTQLLFLVRL